MTVIEGSDAYDAALALGVDGPLHEFNAAGVLSTSDVHVALRLIRLGAVDDEVVSLGAAFAARAPRLGHVCVDLKEIRGTASSDTDLAADLDALPWPDPARWIDRLASSALVGESRPLHLDGTNLYIDRLWADERAVAADLRERAAMPAPDVDKGTLAAGLGKLFNSSEDPDLQRMAAAACVLRRVAVVGGGPGTGKTRTVARVLALLDDQAEAASARPPLVALAAPTGKAAARLEEAVRGGADDEDMSVDDAVKDRLRALDGVTLHRLLGFSPGNRTRFRHNRLNRLPFDVVVVDETSMVSLSLMARLLEAVRPEARLILVGDPEQLASVEAGAVLGDIVGPASDDLCMEEPARVALAAVTGQRVPQGAGTEAAIGNGIVVLHKVHRFGTVIASLAEAIQRNDADAALRVLEEGRPNIEWIRTDDESARPDQMSAVRAVAVENGRTVIEAARAGDAETAIAALGEFRLLCAHRRGPEGVAGWMQHVEDWLRAEVPGFLTGSEWYVGRPLIVTENDYALRLYNGDTGVVVEAEDGRLVAAFERGGGVAEVSPTRLAAVDTVYAMTVHKSQGSQFHTVAFVVPAAGSRLLTRELLYTAVTRAQERLILVGAEASIRAAVARPISRSSGLRSALWGDGA
ncbi:MAG TPA: exodeoxyribonuclease V subunit alpha [Acidimicrobiales bacterium]|jgi:exodeoxyribonuclease V alpha subunit|nr:exodeoxyribonuclease V subunit alpha [Acidimicrobiales bacterium]